MRFELKAFLCGLVVALASRLCGQSLAPRAYVITPEHWNAIIVTWSFYDGGFSVNGALPITGATGTYNVPIFSVCHSFSFFDEALTSRRCCHTAWGTFKEKSWAQKNQFTAPDSSISQPGFR